MAFLLDVVAKDYSEADKKSLEIQYQEDKASYKKEISELTKRIEENKLALTDESDKKDTTQVTLDDKEQALNDLELSKKAQSDKRKKAQSELKAIEGAKILYDEGLEILEQAYDLVSRDLDPNAFVNALWYLPKEKDGFSYERMVLPMGWKNEQYLKIWREKFTQSQRYHGAYALTRGLKQYGTDPKKSPHLELINCLDKRLGTAERPGTFRKEMAEAEKKLTKVRQEFEEATSALEDIESLIPSAQKEKEEVKTALSEIEKTCAKYTQLILDDETRKAYLEACLKVRDYQRTLLDIRDLRVQYDDSQMSLEDIDKAGETVLNLKRLAHAIETLTGLKEKYEEPIRAWLKDIKALLPEEQFNPVRKEEDFIAVKEDIDAHVYIVDNINRLLADYQAKQKVLVAREERERQARQYKRERLVNELLAPDERVGEGAEDNTSPGLINAYMIHRSQHLNTFMLDCLQSFWQKLVSCFYHYETEKERRERYIENVFKPALKQYRKDGKKDELEANLDNGEQSDEYKGVGRSAFGRRTKPGSTGAEFTFQFLLTNKIDKMPSATDVVAEDDAMSNDSFVLV